MFLFILLGEAQAILPPIHSQSPLGYTTRRKFRYTYLDLYNYELRFVDEVSLTVLFARVLSLPVRILSQNLGNNFSRNFNYRPFHRRDYFVVWFQFAVCYCHSYWRCNPPRISDYRFLRRPWQTELPQAMQSLCTRLTLKFIQKDMICVVYCIVDPRSLIANT